MFKIIFFLYFYRCANIKNKFFKKIILIYFKIKNIILIYFKIKNIILEI